LWALRTQGGSRGLPGGERSPAKLVSAVEFPVYQGNREISFDLERFGERRAAENLTKRQLGMESIGLEQEIYFYDSGKSAR
jgi:hypothetical protein